MAIDFEVKDTMHDVVAKFVPKHLPDVKKPYSLKAVFQPELDVHGIASKAEVYNIDTDPKVIEEGFNAACACPSNTTGQKPPWQTGSTLKSGFRRPDCRGGGKYGCKRGH